MYTYMIYVCVRAQQLSKCPSHLWFWPHKHIDPMNRNFASAILDPVLNGVSGMALRKVFGNCLLFAGWILMLLICSLYTVSPLTVVCYMPPLLLIQFPVIPIFGQSVHSPLPKDIPELIWHFDPWYFMHVKSCQISISMSYLFWFGFWVHVGCWNPFYPY